MKGASPWRIAVAVVVFALQFGGLSFVINELWLGPEHEVYTFWRPEDDFRLVPGLGITTLLWSATIVLSYQFFGERLNIQNNFLHGATYGVLVYLFFVFFQELYYYQFIAFDWIITAGAQLHYLLAFGVGCGLVGVLLRPALRDPEPKP